MGIAYDKVLETLYTIGEDGKFVVSGKSVVSGNAAVAEITPEMRNPLKFMLFLAERALFIIGDSEGHIYIYTQRTVSSIQ
jgi:hypothetical protein